MQVRVLVCVLVIIGLFPLTDAGADQVLLRLHGSNTIGAELAPALVEKWLAGEGYRSIERRQGRVATESLIRARDRKGRGVVVEIHAHGSSTGFASLAESRADIGLSSRPIKSAEVGRLKAVGDMTSYRGEYVLGLDGIAVIVHPDNPVASLDKAQVRRLFSGEIKSWSDIGGPAGAVHVYARDAQSGTFDTFKSLVLGKKTRLSPAARRFESNARLSDAVSRDIHGIGFVALPYVRDTRALALSDKEARAIVPTGFSVATEDYALARRLFLYVPPKGDNPHARAFAEFAVSDRGQAVVRDAGFISQVILEGDMRATDGVSDEYARLIEGAKRLSLNFRFRRGDTRPDSKAKRDLDRLVAYLARPENRGRKVTLVGFADNNEILPIYSLELSVARADAVADRLIRMGVAPSHVRGYGQASPVASNDSEHGRVKNRRVEVWLD